MNVLVSGAGIAGLTVAFALVRDGHSVTLVEKSPRLRGEGYMIDFFGSGYDAAEQMGLLPELEAIHYPIPRFAFVDEQGREKFSVSYAHFRRLFGGRHFNFMRGDLERLLHSKVTNSVQLRFGVTIESFVPGEQEECVDVVLSDGTIARFDLVIGADGVHSRVRELEFGPERQFARFLGYRTAAFILAERPRRARADVLYTLNALERQVGVYPISDGRAATFFVYKAHRQLADFSFETAVQELHAEYRGLDWIVPELIDRCDRASLYFDEVSQIELPRWSTGRVVFVGDACQCVSLLAGQGASMAMGGAYVLAQELSRAGRDVRGALHRYEERVKPTIEKKQRAGRRIAGWFVPHNRVQRAVNDLVTRMAGWPVAWRLIRGLLAPESVLAVK